MLAWSVSGSGNSTAQCPVELCNLIRSCHLVCNKQTKDVMKTRSRRQGKRRWRDQEGAKNLCACGKEETKSSALGPCLFHHYHSGFGVEWGLSCLAQD